METAYIYALGANLSFAIGIQFFTHFARNISSVWVNCFKAAIALICFAITIYFKGGFNPIELKYFMLFCASGFLGLGFADIFLIKSFSMMGPGRTMVLFTFQPVIVGILSYFLFSQVVTGRKLFAILFMIICLVIFSIETYKTKGHWNVKASIFALSGMFLDAMGVLVTRYCFNNSTQITTAEGNFYRVLGAIALFMILSKVRPFNFIKRLKSLPVKSLMFITIGALLGTYIALTFYLKAIRIAPTLAVISAISITGATFASILECVVNRKPPSKYLMVSFIFFITGMWFLFF